MPLTHDNRDSIDFGKAGITLLFVKLFFPTLLGLAFIALFNIADGIFVGKGVGSMALAAVNIAGPLFFISTAVALMFATGVSVVAAIHLSQKNYKAANINVTQAVMASTIILTLFALILVAFPGKVNYLFGGTPLLEPLVKEYINYIWPWAVFLSLALIGSFVIRLDGAPKYAMCVNVIPSTANIFLDWLFVFPLNMGIKGAALGTSICEGVAAVMVIVYFVKYSKNIHFYKLKSTAKSLALTLRNIGYMVKVGFATFIGEIAISLMLLAGNYLFMSYLHEDGIAAFTVACYTFPLIFMFGSAVAQSALPIASYNYGIKQYGRISSTLKVSLIVGLFSGIVLTLAGVGLSKPLVGLFLDRGTQPYLIAVQGFPYFALSFVFSTLNLILIGFYQSIKKAASSIVFMFLRGCVILVPVFISAPMVFGIKGLWLAVPLSELLTFIVILVTMLIHRPLHQKIAAENER